MSTLWNRTELMLFDYLANYINLTRLSSFSFNCIWLSFLQKLVRRCDFILFFWKPDFSFFCAALKEKLQCRYKNHTGLEWHVGMRESMTAFSFLGGLSLWEPSNPAQYKSIKPDSTGNFPFLQMERLWCFFYNVSRSKIAIDYKVVF